MASDRSRPSPDLLVPIDRGQNGRAKAGRGLLVPSGRLPMRQPEGTFGTVHQSPHYNTLLRMDPVDRPGTGRYGTGRVLDVSRTEDLYVKLARGRLHDGSS